MTKRKRWMLAVALAALLVRPGVAADGGCSSAAGGSCSTIEVSPSCGGSSLVTGAAVGCGVLAVGGLGYLLYRAFKSGGEADKKHDTGLLPRRKDRLARAG